MKKKHNKDWDEGMGEWGSNIRKDCIKLFYSHEYQSALHLNQELMCVQEALGSRYKALGVYETFIM